MRTLLILIKRQIVDDAVYFVAAVTGLCILILTILVLVFLYSPRDVSPLERITYLFHVPFLLALGFCTLGIAQSHGDHLTGRLTWLSAQSVYRWQVVLARVISGSLLLASAFGLMVLIASIYVRLMPADVYSRRLLTEVFVSVFLMSLACYGLGLRLARSTNSVTRALATLPLALLLPLLLIVKGFGWPVCGLFLIVAVASFVGVIWPSIDRLAPVLASGVVAIVLSASLLFLGRYLCNLAWVGAMSEEARRVEISPSGIVPPMVEKDPNVVRQSSAKGWIHAQFACSGLAYDAMKDLKPVWHLLAPLGIVEYFRARNPESGPKRYHDPSTNGRFYFDAARGQLIYRFYQNEYELYVGPEGMSEAPDAEIGRFAAPLIAPAVLYDRHCRRFFALDFKRRTVLKGPVLEDPSLCPVEIGLPCLGKPRGCNVQWSPPYGHFGFYEASRRLLARRGSYTAYTAYTDYWFVACRYFPLLNASGEILLFDRQTLALKRCGGQLPRPYTLFGKGSCQPAGLLSYSVVPINRMHQYALAVLDSEAFHEFAGVVATSLSRDGMGLTMAVYDEEGQLIKTAHTRMFATNPWGGMAMALRYTFESLHPPVLTLASFFTAHSFEAAATHRALFLMPNSFVALQGDRQTTLFAQLAWAVLFMAPAFLFAAFLAWRIATRGAKLGLCRRTWGLWSLSTLLLGVPAYATFRLTYPRVALVTCAECGCLRRPDQDECHYCAGGWHGSHLAAPAWRIKEKPEAALQPPPAESNRS